MRDSVKTLDANDIAATKEISLAPTCLSELILERTLQPLDPSSQPFTFSDKILFGLAARTDSFANKGRYKFVGWICKQVTSFLFTRLHKQVIPRGRKNGI